MTANDSIGYPAPGRLTPNKDVSNGRQQVRSMKWPRRKARQSIILRSLPVFLMLLLTGLAAIEPTYADTGAGAPPGGQPGSQPDSRLGDEGLRSALRSAGLADDPAAPWTPDRITIAALYFDPSMRTARWTAQVAAADAQIAAQRANPIFSFSPERVVSAVGVMPAWTIVAVLAIPWMYPGEYTARKEAAQLDASIAQLTLATGFWQSRTRSLAALRKVLVARQIEALATQSAAAQSSWAAGVNKRMKLGDADRGELAVAQSAATAADAEKAIRIGQRVTAEREMAAALSISSQSLASMQLEWPQLQAPPEPSTVIAANPAATALANRLELQALALQEQAAEARWREALAGRFPKADITPTATYDRGDTKIGLGFDVELPIHHGADAAIRRADAARHEAVTRLEQRQIEVAATADASVAGYSAQYAELQSFRAATVAAHTSEVQAQRALAVGEGDRGTLLQAVARRTALEVQSLDALQRTLDALAAVEEVAEHPLWPGSVLGDVRKAAPYPSEDARAHTP